MECDTSGAAAAGGSLLGDDDLLLEKVLAMTESLDPGLGYVFRSKVQLSSLTGVSS